MKTKCIFLTILATALMNCGKNNDAAVIESPELQNEPPLSFNLLEVPDNALEVNVTPTISWESAKNPEGSKVTYDLYLGTDTNPTNLFQGNIAETSLEITERLNLISDYYWKVVATDVEGRSSQSPIHKFTTRNLIVNRRPFVANAAFPARWGHTSVAFNESLWVIGGSNDGFSNDIWQSADGITWKQVMAENHFSDRREHASVVFDNKIWVIGGRIGTDTSSKIPLVSDEVWSSSDGMEWTQVNESAAFEVRSGHTVTVFNEAMYLIGGGYDSSKNDVWRSTNGSDWELVTSSAPFSVRSWHTATVFNGKLWVIGGNDYTQLDGVWLSEDGLNWTEAQNAPGFSGRSSHTSFVFDNRLWVLGGRAAFDTYFKEAWYTKDGQKWAKHEEEFSLLPRTGHSTTVFDHRAFITAGINRTELSAVTTNEVWVLE